MPFKKILIAVDSSALALKAAQAGLDLAREVNAEAALLFVIDRSKESVSVDAGPTKEQSEMILLKEAEDTLDQLIKMYKGAKKIYRFTPEGFPKEEIVKVAKEWEADVIVMGRHERKGVSHFFSGSLAEHVIRHACVPVLLIPPQMK